MYAIPLKAPCGVTGFCWRTTLQPVPCPSALPAAAAAESPDQSLLAVVIREAEQRERVFTSQVADYTCTLVKRERINGQLQGYEYADVKIRHRQVRNGQTVVVDNRPGGGTVVTIDFGITATPET